MTIETFDCGLSERVENLCKRLGIPLVEIRFYETPEQIEEGLKMLLEPKK